MTETVGAKILIIDHNDSFTFNLVQLLEEAGAVEVMVISADQVITGNLENYDGIVLSPGPGLPGDYPNTAEVIRYCIESGGKIPLLGVCLGFQAIALYFGGGLINLDSVQHGRQVAIDAGHPCMLLEKLPFPMEVGLYHSWAMDPSFPVPELLITSFLKHGENNSEQLAVETRQVPMSLQHIHLPLFGVQFHPESYMTRDGADIIKNWLKIVANAAGIMATELEAPF